MEMRDLIVRSVGEHTDVVSKELYEFKDKKGRDLVLKPESTAGVMRSYLENFQNEPQPVYLYYIEPHFRYDRPQKGRYRQFHQIGAEIIGERDPVLDAENIHMAVKILSDCGLK
ncbi:ATP phosphoribosyltransferase regulatory subunit [Candidatus Peribacteria bacterium]|nr:ATP phosphoribosyltransferase regulatory subunit [Candidatus Peribacteria bacterium]